MRIATAAAAALLAVAACSDSMGSKVGVPASIAPVAGAALTGEAGSPLTNPVAVVVRDGNGAPVAGVVVGFKVADGGGTVAPAEAQTDGDGIARAQWVLGGEVGEPQTLVAAVRADLTATLNATAQVGGNVSVITTGDAQDGQAGSALPLAVEIRQNGVPLSGSVVRWAVVQGRGGVSRANGFTRTDAQGRAALDYLPTGVGEHVVTASAQGLPTQYFTMRVTPGAPARLSFSPESGSYVAGSTLTGSTSVLDAYDNVVPGVTVQVSVSAGSVASRATASGGAEVLWTLPGAYATYTLTAAAAGLTTTATATVAYPSAPVLLVVTPSVVYSSFGWFTANLYDIYGHQLQLRGEGAYTGCRITWSAGQPYALSPPVVQPSTFSYPDASVSISRGLIPSLGAGVFARCGSLEGSAGMRPSYY